MRRVLVVGLVLAAVLLVWWIASSGTPVGPDRILVARSILTMDPEQPRARAVAIEKGRISAVGSLEEVQAAVGEDLEVDDRFRDQVLLPGFIDPHVHPTLAATILNLEIVSAMEWATPTGRTHAVRGRDAFLERLRELDAEAPAGEWLVVWGYHEPYHGELSRADLDRISETRPIFVWQRSAHEMFFNGRALDELDMDEQAWTKHPQASWEDGHLWETGALELGQPMLGVIASPGRYLEGLGKMTKILHRGGLTTVAEQGFPQVSALIERLTLRFEMWRSDAPYRFALVPNAMYLLREEGSGEDAVRAASALLDESDESIRTVRHAKYYADGAIFSQLMQMTEPYLDGHHGEWMMTPEEQVEVLVPFWRDGWGIHVHVNGDAGLDVVLDQIEEQQREHPSPGRRIVMEHYGYARDDQHKRLAELGIDVSNNAYYLHELAPIYAEYGLGPERAADISPLGALERAGVPVSFHSDFPMAPAEPLTLVWVAVNRIASDGRVWGEDQRMTLEAALRAVTIEAARSIGLEDEIGSIAVGKRADFTVLGRDPHQVEPNALRDIPLWGTVLNGRAHPLTDPTAEH